MTLSRGNRGMAATSLSTFSMRDDARLIFYMLALHNNDFHRCTLMQKVPEESRFELRIKREGKSYLQRCVGLLVKNDRYLVSYLLH